MKKFLSLFLSIVILFSITAGIDLTASAADNVKSTSISFENWYSGYLTGNNIKTWYKLILPSDGKITIKVLHYMPMTGYMYNEDFSSCIWNGEAILNGGYNDEGLRGGASDSPVTNTICRVLSKGEYYVGLNSSNDGKYKIIVSFESFSSDETEPNDFEHAMYLSRKKWITSSFTYQDNEDWYKICVPTKSNVTIKVTHYQTMLFCLFNFDLSNCIINGGSTVLNGMYNDNALRGGSESSPETKVYNVVLPEGEYYIRTNKHNDCGKYKIVWNFDCINHKFEKVSCEKATTSKNGIVKYKCSMCSATKSTEIVRISKISINKNTFTTNGKVQRPTVTVTDSKGNALKLNKDYTVSYSNANSKNVGRYTVTVKLIGNYSGTKTFPYYINPKPTEFVPSNKGGFKAIKKGFTLKWNKKSSQTTGYQIQYATKRDFSNAATVTIANPNTTSKTIKGRAGNTRYYVRVRTYKKIGSGTFYSSWNSGVKSVVTLR